MATRYTVVCDDGQARAIETLARRHGIAEDEVLEQLIDLGLEGLESQTL